MTATAAGPSDPLAVLRSPRYVALLAAAAVVGLVISLLAWGFLELVAQIQDGVFTDLPKGLGFDGAPSWWPLPVLVLAGVPVALALRLPGEGGHVPAGGLQMGMTTPPMLPGVLLAALATLGFGVVLGPEAPLIALGGGATLLMVGLVKRDAPDQMKVVLAAAGTFAAVSMIFQSPVVAAVLLIEATGLGGPTLPVVLLPGLLAAGVGSLTFIGVSGWIGLDTSAYSLAPVSLASFPRPTLGDLAWTLLLSVVAAVAVFGVRRIGLWVAPRAARHPFLVVPLAGAVVAVLAIAFASMTDHGNSEVLFSGQDQLPGLVADAGTWSMGALALLLLFKGLAWGTSLGSFRGGPTFPALYLGAAGGLLAGHLPGLATTPAVAVGMAAMVSAMLRLPLSAAIIAIALCIGTGGGSAPLAIVASVTAYLVSVWLDRPAGPVTSPRMERRSDQTPEPQASSLT